MLGYCIRCSPNRYVLDKKAFDKACRTGNKIVDGNYSDAGTVVEIEPKKAVHVFRNVFDNVVARLHMQRKNWESHGDKDNHLSRFESNMEGFRRWCQYIDSSTKKDLESTLLDDETKRLYNLVPCRAEFFRYTHWHNRAMQVVEQRKLPVHYLFYENYTINFNETVEELLDFIELPAVREPPPFIPGKVYPEYFTSEEKQNAARLVRHVATDEVWSLIKHYFEDILVTDVDN